MNTNERDLIQLDETNFKILAEDVSRMDCPPEERILKAKEFLESNSLRSEPVKGLVGLMARKK